MQLALDSISKRVGAQTWLYDMSLALQSNAVTVLLGATQAGKTSLMRIMAGLDTPTAGKVTVDGVDVTGMPVRERNVAMVYQQFINYPSMTVFDNIASPLKLRGDKDVETAARWFGLFFVVIWIGSVHLAYHYAVDGLVSVIAVAAIWRVSAVVITAWDRFLARQATLRTKTVPAE